MGASVRLRFIAR